MRFLLKQISDDFDMTEVPPLVFD